MKAVFIVFVLLAIYLIWSYRSSGYSQALGYDVAGSTLFTGRNRDECQSWCNQNSSCKGFVQYQDNTCQCKSTLDSKYQVNGATFFIK